MSKAGRYFIVEVTETIVNSSDEKIRQLIGNKNSEQNIDDKENVDNVAMDVEGTPLNDDSNQLKTENKLLKEQLGRLTRVLSNMNKELTELKNQA